MVERSRRKKEAEMNDKTSRMVFATAALAAVAAVLAGPAGAQIPEGTGVQPVSGQSDERQAQSSGSIVVPYLSQGMGVDEAQFSGTGSRRLAGPAASQQGVDVAIKTAIASRAYESQSLGLTGDSALTRASTPESSSLGLTGDSPLSRVVAHEPVGLSGDSALTRVSGNTPAPTFSKGEDFDWTSFGAGAGMVALVAAGIMGILLTARRRHTIGLP